MDTTAIQKIIDAYSQRVTAKLGIGFKDFDTGQELCLNGDEPFPAASTFKVPLLITLYERAAAGSLSLDDKYTLREEDIAIGSGVLSTLTPGLSLPLRDYATLMMIVSDNTATDVIYHHVGADNIRNMIGRMNLANTRCDLSCDHLVRKVYGIPLDISPKEARAMLIAGDAVADEALYVDMTLPNDVSSPRDMVTMFSLIHNRQVVSPGACDAMMATMTACQTNSRIPYYLPGRGPNKAKVAHKTGTLFAVANDCGVITTATRQYALALFGNGFNASAEEKAQNGAVHLYDHLLAELSRDAFEAMHRG